MTDASPVEPAVPGSATWWLARGERQARRRPRVAGLTAERITEVALKIVDREGLDALTVRRLADQLHTGSASLYRHVASRDELLVLLVDHILGDVHLPSPERPGRDKVERLARELRRVLMAHADLLPALAASPLLGPNALNGVEAGLSYFLESGYPPSVAVPAHLALIDYVLGTVFFDTSRAGRAAADGSARAEVLAAGRHRASVLPADVRGWTAPSAEAVFDFGLAVFLDGLAGQLPDGADRTRER